MVGDLTSPEDVAGATRGVTRMYFNTSASPEYVEASAVVSAVVRELGGLEAVVNMSQMTDLFSQSTGPCPVESTVQIPVNGSRNLIGASAECCHSLTKFLPMSLG
jgi:hypothetical protein